MSVDHHSVSEIAARLRSGEISSRELLENCLQSIERFNPRLNAFVYLDPERALQTARSVDDARARGADLGPLAGIPFGVKDLEDVRGMPTQKGSGWFVGARAAERDDIHVERIRAAGAIPVGKTATPEFGSSAFTATSSFGVTRNPWDPRLTPGGSSGGSAAAVASRMVPFCTASDGGGSIRTPAAFTGLPGLRPVYGRVPTFGSTHYAQNAVNFALASTVMDTAMLLDICSGPDPRDRTSLPASESFFEGCLSLETRGLRSALSLDLGFGIVDSEIAEAVTQAYERLVEVASLRPTDIVVETEFFFDTYVKLEGVDRWIELPQGYWPQRENELTPDVRGSWASSARARLPQIAEVFTARRRLEELIASYFEDIDVLITPATSVLPFPADGPLPDRINNESVHPFMSVAQPVLASLCNLPAMNVPVGLSREGLPIGMQIIGGQHREDRCLRLARLMEESDPWPELDEQALKRTQ